MPRNVGYRLLLFIFFSIGLYVANVVAVTDAHFGVLVAVISTVVWVRVDDFLQEKP